MPEVHMDERNRSRYGGDESKTTLYRSGDRLCRNVDFKDSLADSSNFLLLKQIAGTLIESWRLRHISYATPSLSSLRMLARKLP